MIKARFQIPTASPGAMLREEKRRGTDLGRMADELTSRGALLPDELIVNLVRAWLLENDNAFVFDGFPRTVGQADALGSLLEELQRPLDVVIALESDVECLRSRVTNRL